jgi:sterol desaturase/sphingolipid hydroxylase (fatty acid hydroxylase superfamily)
MTGYIICIGIAFIILERVLPDQKLPHVKGWWTRVIILNVIQIGILYLGRISWDNWFQGKSIFTISNYVNEPLGGFIAYIIITFVFYWWHRWRHTVDILWLSMHQIHHSPQRIETITSFYKHPLEICCNSIIIGVVNFSLLGLTLDSAAWCLLFSAIGEYFYHMNIKTPHWLGYIFQRPEMHRIHHERGKHYHNFSDLPIWDMLFGTFKNPKAMYDACGFKPERERRLVDMLLFKNVNNPYPPTKKK